MSESSVEPPGKPCPPPDPSFALIASLLNGTPVLFWATDAKLIMTAVSGGALPEEQRKTNGYVGQPLNALFVEPDTLRKASNAHLTALSGNRCSFTAHMNGRELQAYVEPLRTGGVLGGTIGLAIDSTERLVTERALRISEQSYRSLIEEAPSAILRSTMSGQLLQVNRAMLEMLGYDAASEQELLIRDLPMIFMPGGFDEFRRMLSAKSVVQGFESVWLRRDSRQIHVRLSGRSLHTEGTAENYLDILAEDITEKKQLELQLSHAQKMQALGQLAGGVAHDFNNLLMIITGHLEMLLADSEDFDLYERLNPVKEAAERAAALTGQLLAFSRRHVFQSKIIDVNEVIERFSGILTRLIKETVHLTFDLETGASCVRADPHQIEQVLMNLALNAQDAMPGGGHLTIETANLRLDSQPLGIGVPTRGDQVRITVRDTGAGMDAATQARIFEPFFTTKGVGKGTGLGLSMVYGIVRQSGGQIAVESAPGAGCAFDIYLPRVSEAADPVSGEAGRKNTRARAHETILVAEDEEALRELVTTCLRNLGYEVLAACDGAHALDVARSHSGEIHLLLSDFVMPRTGGRELLAGLKEIFPSVKAIFMSGYAGNAATDADLERPGALFLTKPLSMEALARVIRGALDETPRALAAS